LRYELLITRQIYTILAQDGPIAQKLASILVECCLIWTWVDLGADLTGLDHCVVVARKRLNDAGNVAPDDNREDGIDGAGRGYRARDGAALV
jgi:hypothetical protein